MLQGATEGEYTLNGNNPQINVDTYPTTLSITSDYYEAKEVEATLTINKADPEYEVPTGLAGTAGDSLSTINLPEGFSWNDPSHIIEDINDNKFTVTYTPKDTNNYKIVNNIEVTIKVNKGQSHLESTLDEYIFMYSASTLNEVKLIELLLDSNLITNTNPNANYRLTINGIPASITNEGKYTIKIESLDDESYSSDSIEITFILIEVPSIIDIAYGDALTGHEPASQFGTWKFVDEYVKKFDATIAAVFTSESGVSKEFNLKANISKRNISIDIVKNSFVYDGDSHQLEFDISGVTGWDDADEIKALIQGNKSIENVNDSYNYELTLNDERYQLDKPYTGRLEITEAEVDIKFSTKEDLEQTVNNDYPGDKKLVSKWFDRNNEIQSTITLGVYFKGTDTPADAKINVNGKPLSSSEIIITKYGTNSYEIAIIDPNYNEFSFTITKDILIARVTTKTSNITSLEADIAEGYPTLDGAINASENAQTTTYIYVYGDCEISSDVTIGTNVELYLPHSSAVTEWINYNPKTGESNDALDVNNVQIESTLTRYNLITINEDVTLTINGCLTIGADRGQNAGASGSGSIEADTRSGYSEVVLNGDIVVNGYIYCYGYIRGTGKIEAKSGSSIYEPFVIKDWPGATIAGGVYGGKNSKRTGNNRVPFNQFEVKHIEVETKINYGANLIGLAAIYTSKATVTIIFPITIPAQWNTTKYPLLGTGGILEAMDSDSYIIKKYNKATNQTSVQIYGNVKDNYGSLNVDAFPGLITLEMSTQNLFFPISHYMNVEVMPNSNLTLNEKYKLLPGSSLIIHENANLNLNGQIIVYKDWVDKNVDAAIAAKKTIPLYPSDKPNANLIVEGRLTVIGGLAGVIDGTNNAILDLTNAAYLELTSKEGSSEHGATSLLNSVEMNEYISAVQHLFAYNIGANNITVDWSTISLGDAPAQLDEYKLNRATYTFTNGTWVEQV